MNTHTDHGYTETTFTNGDHTLHRYVTAGGRVDYEIESTGYIHLYLRIDWKNEANPVTFDINWASIGPVSPGEAEEFAADIAAATEAAEDFTDRILRF